MKILYNKNHLHISVGAALLIGMALGTWLGMRSGDAGFLESTMVFVGFAVLSHITMAVIDKRYLPRVEDSEE